MAGNNEKATGSGFLEGWKKLNKITAVGSVALGFLLEQPAFFALAALDVGQNFAINKFEDWQGRRKAVRGLGKTAIAGA